MTHDADKIPPIDPPGGDPDRDRDLDRLLNAAQWPEPDEETIERLRDRWKQISGAGEVTFPDTSPGRTWRIAVLVVAATALICASVFLADRWLQDQAQQALPPIARDDSIEQQAADGNTDQVVHSDRQSHAIRDANLFETALVQRANRMRRWQDDAAQAHADRLQAWEPLIEQVGMGIVPDALQWAPHQRDRRLILERLRKIVEKGGAEIQSTAMRTMVVVAGQDAVAWLRPYCSQPELRPEAMQLIAPFAPSTSLAQSIIVEGDAEVRQELISELFQRDDSMSVTLFLNLVDTPALRAESLEVAGQAARAPRRQLLSALLDPSFERRTAAALTLGKVADEQQVQQLMRMALSNQRRQEVLIALAASSNPQARRFLQLASREPEFAAPLLSVWAQLRTSLP